MIVICVLCHSQNITQICFNCPSNACTANGCSSCATGFMLSSQGWCGIFTPIAGCIVYDYLYTNRCTACSSDRMLIDSRCYIKPQNC
jgi:hypothetical protein